MPKHRRRRKLSGPPYIAVANTGLPCTKEDRLTMQAIAMSIKTACGERVPACDQKNRLVVTAKCPTAGAAISFKRTIEKVGGAIDVSRRGGSR